MHGISPCMAYGLFVLQGEHKNEYRRGVHNTHSFGVTPVSLTGSPAAYGVLMRMDVFLY